MSQTARYALYFAPPPNTHWWKIGAEWLGRDPACEPSPSAVSLNQSLNFSSNFSSKFSEPDVFARLIEKPARYGFHATLKAPFQLCEGASEAQLEQMAQTFAASEACIPLQNLQLETTGDFLSLRAKLGTSANQRSGTTLRRIF